MSMSQGSGRTGREGMQNGRTFFCGSRDALREALSPRASFVLAYERIALLAHASSEQCVVVAAIDVSGQVVAARRVFHRQAVIVGRHEQCGVRLPALSIALRQVAALVQLDGGACRIHVRDLATRQPFRTEDGKPSAGVTADGPLYVAVGEHALWFVPGSAISPGERSAEAAWNALAPRRFTDRLPPIDAPTHPRVRALVGRDVSEQTRVTHVAPPLLLDSGDAPEVAWGVLRLEAGARKEKRWVSAERLEQGILLGRYSRCSVLLDASEATTSRVHALLMRLGADVWVIDLASTNGIHRAGAPLTADILRDNDRISLGTQVVIGWQRTLHAQA